MTSDKTQENEVADLNESVHEQKRLPAAVRLLLSTLTVIFVGLVVVFFLIAGLCML